MKTAKTIWNIVTWTIVVLAVVIAILLAGVRLVGIDPYTVLSGSMEPEYHVGSIIYVVDVDPHELKKGDPVTYMLSDSVVVTHRIEEIVPAVDETGAPVINDRTGKQAIRFVTKGDANNSADGSLLHENNVIGKPIFSIPYLVSGLHRKLHTEPPRNVYCNSCCVPASSGNVPARHSLPR